MNNTKFNFAVLVIAAFVFVLVFVACTNNNEVNPTAENYIEDPTVENYTGDTTAEIYIEDSVLAAALRNNEYVIAVEYVPECTLIARMIAELAELGIDPPLAYRIRYISDAYEVIGYVAAPYDFLDYKYPILIFNRGGNQNFGSLRSDTAAFLAARGYIVLASQYRGVAGGTGREQFGGDDINDVLRLIDISESFDFAQQGGVYMLGASRGGMMTYIACRIDDRIRAAAVWAGPSDIAMVYFERRYEREDVMWLVLRHLIGGPPEGEWLVEYERRSAVLWANEIHVPLLIGQGDADYLVPPHHATNMAAALERYGKPHRLIIYPGVGHGFAGSFLDEMDEWFRQHPITGP